MTDLSRADGIGRLSWLEYARRRKDLADELGVGTFGRGASYSLDRRNAETVVSVREHHPIRRATRNAQGNSCGYPCYPRHYEARRYLAR
jgi:hypothetical protein